MPPLQTLGRYKGSSQFMITLEWACLLEQNLSVVRLHSRKHEWRRPETCFQATHKLPMVPTIDKT